MDDRGRKAGKIYSILQDFCDGSLYTFNCLDLGCSQGVISTQLAAHLKLVIGIDLDIISLKTAEKIKSDIAKPPFYMSANGYDLPFNNDQFDLIICAQVYEHVTDASKIIAEIGRVLKPGGICFFSGPNRLSIMEEHYWLPFLSWLPHSWASIYMKLMKRGKLYDIHPLTYWQLIKLWDGFTVYDYTTKIIREPHRFSVDDRVEKYGFISILPDWIINFLRPLYPNYNWIVVKSL
jgi:2-polyprenyl-3-methyl-5-hydroxy-6-metoxy-1,4-benzoquinol methylase